MTENKKKSTKKEVDESEGQLTHSKKSHSGENGDQSAETEPQKEMSAKKAEDYGLGSEKKEKRSKKSEPSEQPETEVATLESLPATAEEFDWDKFESEE